MVSPSCYPDRVNWFHLLHCITFTRRIACMHYILLGTCISFEGVFTFYVHHAVRLDFWIKEEARRLGYPGSSAVLMSDFS